MQCQGRLLLGVLVRWHREKACAADGCRALRCCIWSYRNPVTLGDAVTARWAASLGCDGQPPRPRTSPGVVCCAWLASLLASGASSLGLLGTVSLAPWVREPA